ncbi:MAG: FHA domain-containing protein [Proteobacteria bacterium]|nr:FHA domain-containing protein [Pseudomonadota bacterium]
MNATGTVLGRLLGDVKLDDREVSAVHALISFTDGVWQVVDLGSTNGIYVDGRLTISDVLANGSKVKLGRTEFQFRIGVAEPEGDATSPMIPKPPEGRPETTRSLPGAAVNARAQTQRMPRTGDISDPPPVEAVPWASATPHPRLLVSLTVAAGPEQGTQRQFFQEQIVIGRRSVDFVTDDEQVSRRHAVIEVFSEDQVLVRDLESTNGTFLNGHRVTSAWLNDGDRLSLGSFALIVAIERP